MGALAADNDSSSAHFLQQTDLVAWAIVVAVVGIALALFALLRWLLHRHWYPPLANRPIWAAERQLEVEQVGSRHRLTGNRAVRARAREMLKRIQRFFRLEQSPVDLT